MNELTTNERRLILWITKQYSTYFRIWSAGWWFSRTDSLDAYFWK